MAIVTVSVHGQILDPDTALPAVGSVTFKTLTELRDTVDNIVYEPGIWTETLDINGEFTVVLPATDSPDITPSGWLYQVYISTSHWRDTFFVSLPAILAPAVEFADLIPVQPADGSGCTPDGTACAPISIVAEVAALSEAVDDLSTEVADLAALVNTFAGDITTLQGQVATLQIDVAALISTVNILTPIVFANQAAITVLQGQVATIQGQITTIQGQITTLQGQVATNTANITTNTTNITTLQGQMTTVQGQITTIQGQILTLQTDLATLAANTVLLNPTSGGVYNGNTFTTPPNPAGVQPWLKSNVIPYSAGDTNFDIVRFRAQDEFGNTVNTGTYNGNGEGRDRPSSRTRVARRTFESAEAVGGSTAQYVQWSSDATLPANREPFLGGWGSASAKPGWVEATRVLSGLQGVSIGGTVNAALAPYNSLSAFAYRGLKTTAGPPAAGTWAVNDVILDSVGVVYRCTVAGTPGTWVGAVNGTPLAVAFTGLMGNAATISDGTSTGAPYALATTYNPADNRVYFDGAMANNGGVSIAGGTVLFTVNAAHAPAAWVQCNERTSTLLSSRVTVRPDGTCRLDQAMAAAATVSLDGFNYRKS